MKEQSHKHEMSAALRGDFQRLRDRGVAAALAPRDDAPPAAVPAPVDVRERTAAETQVDERPGRIARLLGRVH